MKVAGFIFHKIMGWKIGGEGILPTNEPKVIFVMTPHTSWIDFMIGWLYYKSVNKRSEFIIKKEFFVFPIKGLLKRMGGIPINRKKGKEVLSQLIESVKERDRIHLSITPEGTRKPNPYWKNGFYYIAQKANIPIQPVCFDYAKKEMVFSDPYFVEGTVKEEMEKLKTFVRKVNPTPKVPCRFKIDP